MMEIINKIEAVQDRYGRLAKNHPEPFNEIDGVSFYLQQCLTQNAFPRGMSLDEHSQNADRLAERIKGLLKTKDEVIAAIIREAELVRERWQVAQPTQPPKRYDTGFHGSGQPNAIVTEDTVDQIISEWKDRVHGSLGIEKHRLHQAWSQSGPQTYKGIASRAQDFLINVFCQTWRPALNFHIEVMKD